MTKPILTPVIQTPAPPHLVKDAWLFDSEVIVPGQMSLLTTFFRDTRCFQHTQFGCKTRYDTNLVGNGGSLPRTYTLSVREVAVQFVRATEELAASIAESEIVFFVNQRTPIATTSVGAATKRFKLDRPYALLELQYFGVDWKPPAAFSDGHDGEEQAFLMRVALVGELAIHRYAAPHKRDWFWETHVALDHRNPGGTP